MDEKITMKEALERTRGILESIVLPAGIPVALAVPIVTPIGVAMNNLNELIQRCEEVEQAQQETDTAEDEPAFREGEI